MGTLIYPKDRKSPEEGAAADIHELVGSQLLFIQFSFGETKEKLREGILLCRRAETLAWNFSKTE